MTAFRDSDFREKCKTDSGINASLFVNMAAFPSFLLKADELGSSVSCKFTAPVLPSGRHVKLPSPVQ
jgi:hypothetical protein